MAVAQKFLFDDSFDGPGGPPAAASGGKRNPVTPAANAEPTFSRAQLAAAEAAARAEGHSAGVAEAVSRHEKEVAALLARIGETVAAVLAAKAALQRAGERQTVELTRAVFMKLFPTLMKSARLDEVTALVSQCMRESFDEPRLVLRVADPLFAAAQEQIAPLAASTGFAGKLVILGDEALAGSSCRVEWADGGAERDLGRACREIEAALARALETNDTTPNPDTPT